MKSNFRKDESVKTTIDSNKEESQKEFSENEFEDFVVKSGAKGSFMIYRSDKEDDELGLDEL
jgi:hypothetical protein